MGWSVFTNQCLTPQSFWLWILPLAIGFLLIGVGRNFFQVLLQKSAHSCKWLWFQWSSRNEASRQTDCEDERGGEKADIWIFWCCWPWAWPHCSTFLWKINLILLKLFQVRFLCSATESPNKTKFCTNFFPYIIEREVGHFYWPFQNLQNLIGVYMYLYKCSGEGRGTEISTLVSARAQLCLFILIVSYYFCSYIFNKKLNSPECPHSPYSSSHPVTYM